MDSISRTPNEELIARYLAGQAIQAEAREIEHWAGESDANANELASWKKTWSISGKFEINTSYNVDRAWLRVKSKLNAQSTLDKSQSLVSEANIKPLFLGIERQNWYAIAAGIALLFGIYMVFFQPAKDIRLANLNKEVHSENELLEVTLPDSSVVILKPNSSLRYSDPFQPKERFVILDGSAHFDVRKNPSNPFSISTGSCFVKVLGTSFLVAASTDHSSVVVSVETGKVLFSTKQANEPSADGSSVLLLPGDRGQFKQDQQAILLDRVNPVQERFAFDQTVIFTQTDLQTVCELLGKLFNQSILLANMKVKNCMLTATFKGQNLQQILDVIAATFSLEIKNINGQLLLDGEGCL